MPSQDDPEMDPSDERSEPEPLPSEHESIDLVDAPPGSATELPRQGEDR
jgi:hypothetical protein